METLRRLPRFLLLGVTAPVDLRFQRSLARGRPGDPHTLEGFEARERQENTGDPAAQQLSATLCLADLVVDNADDLAVLRRRLDEVIDRVCGASDPG